MDQPLILSIKDLYTEVRAPLTLGSFTLSASLTFLYGYVLSLVYIRWTALIKPSSRYVDDVEVDFLLLINFRTDCKSAPLIPSINTISN